MRKSVLVLALVALTVSLAGCASPPGNADTAGDGNTLAQEEARIQAQQVATQALRDAGVREALVSGSYSGETDEATYVPDITEDSAYVPEIEEGVPSGSEWFTFYNQERTRVYAVWVKDGVAFIPPSTMLTIDEESEAAEDTLTR